MNFLLSGQLIIAIRTSNITLQESHDISVYSFPEGRLLDIIKTDKLLAGVRSGKLSFLNEKRREL